MKRTRLYAYGLEVLKGMGQYNTFLNTLLKPLRWHNEPQYMDMNKEEIWEVREIFNLRRVKGVVQYQVLCTGCTELEDTWQMFDYINNCLKKLQEFWQKFLNKLQDKRYV